MRLRATGGSAGRARRLAGAATSARLSALASVLALAALACVLVLAGALASVLAGCSASPAAPSGAAAVPIKVVAAENVWGSIAAELGGEKAQVRSIISNPNADPHDYEPTVGDARDVADARLAVANGAGYDAWLGQLLGANPNPARVEIDAAQLAGVQAGGNPHVWYSPGAVHRVASAITAGYKRLDPADSAYFDGRLASFESSSLAEYDALVAHIASDYAGTPVGASESLFVSLAQALKLKLITPPAFLSAISEGVDPSVADKATVDDQIRNRRIRVFVYNRQNSTPDVLALAAEAKAAGIPVVTVTETVQPANATFEQWQTEQLRRIEAALKQGTGR